MAIIPLKSKAKNPLHIVCCAMFLSGVIEMKLRELREQKGVTQKEVATAVGCTATVYSRYEREEREPDISTLCSLADYFEVSIDSLIGYSNKQKSEG